MDNIELQISIAADNDGYVLLKCPLCNDFFKLRVDEMQMDDVIDWCCPICGFKSDESYLTDDVIKLAMTKLENEVMDQIYKSIKKIEHKTKNKIVSIKAGDKPQNLPEIQLIAGINNFEIVTYKCCKRSSKMSLINKTIGRYCPYCGVKND